LGLPTFVTQRGLVLFEGKARCVTYYAGFNFTDESFYNLGPRMDAKDPDLGRYGVSKDEADKGAFKIPTLRDVAQQGPYLHDGSLRSLEEVVAFYNRDGQENPWLSKAVGIWLCSCPDNTLPRSNGNVETPPKDRGMESVLDVRGSGRFDEACDGLSRVASDLFDGASCVISLI